MLLHQLLLYCLYVGWNGIVPITRNKAFLYAWIGFSVEISYSLPMSSYNRFSIDLRIASKKGVMKEA
jgi:hypothetical protein